MTTRGSSSAEPLDLELGVAGCEERDKGIAKKGWHPLPAKSDDGPDQIVNSAAKTLYMSGGQMGCPILFRGPNGAASRVGAQHSQDYASCYAHCPCMHEVAPYSAADRIA